MMAGVSQFMDNHIFERLWRKHRQPIREVESILATAGTPARLRAGDAHRPHAQTPPGYILVNEISCQPAGLLAVELLEQLNRYIQPVLLQQKTFLIAETQAISDLADMA